MEQNSILEGSPELNGTETASNAEATSASEPIETPSVAAAPVRRRASRRVTAASASDEASGVADASAGAGTAADSAPNTEDADASLAEEVPKKRVSRARKKVDPADAEAEATAENSAEAASGAGATTVAPAAEAASEVAPEVAEAEAAPAKKAPVRRRRAQTGAQAAETADSPTGDTAPSDEADSPKAETSKSGASRAGASRTGASRAAASDADASDADASNADGVKGDVSVADASNSDASNSDGVNSGASKTGSSRAGSSRAGSSRAGTSRAGTSKAGTSRADASKATTAGSDATDPEVAHSESVNSGSASAESASADSVSAEKPDETAAEATPRRRNTRTRSRKPAVEHTEQQVEQAADSVAAEKPAESDEQADKAEAGSSGNARGTSGGNGNNTNGNNSGGNANGSNANGNHPNTSDGQTRSSRTRQRERKRRGGNDEEPEITEDDVLLPVAGILDVLDNYAFVRTTGYLPGTGDVYVSLGQVKKYGLRKGDAVVGAIRQPRESDSGGRQKYNAIVKVDSINSKPVEETQTRPEFADFTPVHPNERIRLETDASTLGARAIDLFAPIGKGQRGFIVGPQESGKSTALRQIALAVAQNQPDAHLMLVVIDERPEDVTELQRVVNGEVIASTFDRPAEDHATIVDLAVERAKRLVELGHDVIVLIDSLTSLARAYNVAAPAAVRVPAGSLDSAAVFPVKRLLSSARNIENGGSLTIIATVSAQPESKFDEAFLGEIEGIANMQLRLSGDAAAHRVYPAIDLGRSSTRNEALFTSEAEARIMNRIRRSQPVGGSIEHLEHLEQLLGQLGGTSSNVEFLAVTQRQLDA